VNARPGLRTLLAGSRLIVAPGAHDVVTARLIEHAGFPACYMTYPNSLTRVMARAGQRLLDELKSTGTTAGLAADMLTHGELWDLLGRQEWAAREERFAIRRRA
jgi:2-methylisocitrate lyase-like PEP mutase family enzyme